MRRAISLGGYAMGILLPVCMGITSCVKQHDTPISPATVQGEKMELAVPGKKGTVVTAYINGMPVPAELIGNTLVTSGDILLGEGHTKATEGAGLLSKYWPSAVIYYTIDATITAAKKTKIETAIAHWQANTIFRFKLRNTETNYVNFTNSTGCSSYLGMIGGKQNISMADDCSTGNMIHEIGHAAGLYHEQVRADRDNYVIIHWENIEAGYEHNFNAYTSGFDNGVFDFGSIMMYGPTFFSANGQPTISKLDGSTFTYQRTALSTGDKAAISVMYPTPGSNTAPTVSLTAPTAGATFTATAAITLTAAATDADGVVMKVDFYNGTTKIGTDSVAPYAVSWTGVGAGSYSLKAIATDNGGLSATSANVAVTVSAGTTGDCGGIAAWSATTVYATPGIQVSYQGMIFSNKWWIQGTAPNKADTYGPWAFVKNCGE